MLTASLRAFATNLIDYTAMFPPARLTLREAWRRFIGHQDGDKRWMLRRFVLPTTRLADLASAPRFSQTSEPARLALVGRSGPDAATLLAGIEADMAELASWESGSWPVAAVETLEYRLPPSAGPAVVAAAGSALAESPLAARPYFEVAQSNLTADALPALVAAVAMLREKRGLEAGLKVRCGGESPAAFPTTGQLARAIVASRDAGIRMKAAGALRHPVRRRDEALGVHRHGFINLFGAAMLAHRHGLDPATVAAILAEEDASRFRFLVGAFHWRDLSLATPEIARLRRSALTACASCSFTESAAGLAAMGLL